MLADSFELRERRFVERLLQPGMIMLDIGAHHGLYTLLGSRNVGTQGRVLAFEPSTRERNHLLTHLRLNRCKNVDVEPVALGRKVGSGELFVVDGMETGCNCLRPPSVSEPTFKVAVHVDTLDDYLERRRIERVDFIKIDVEGAELEVFKGATRLLNRRPRPIILAEIEDARTAAWNYPAKETVDYLRQYDYDWFRFEGAALHPLEARRRRFNENLVAVPTESDRPDLEVPAGIGTGTKC